MVQKTTLKICITMWTLLPSDSLSSSSCLCDLSSLQLSGQWHPLAMLPLVCASSSTPVPSGEMKPSLRIHLTFLSLVAGHTECSVSVALQVHLAGPRPNS